MKLRFIFHYTLNYNTTQFFDLNELPFKVGDRIKFTPRAQRTLKYSTDSRYRTITKLFKYLGGHYVAELDGSSEIYDCSWLADKKNRVKKL